MRLTLTPGLLSFASSHSWATHLLARILHADDRLRRARSPRESLDARRCRFGPPSAHRAPPEPPKGSNDDIATVGIDTPCWPRSSSDRSPSVSPPHRHGNRFHFDDSRTDPDLRAG